MSSRGLGIAIACVLLAGCVPAAPSQPTATPAAAPPTVAAPAASPSAAPTAAVAKPAASPAVSPAASAPSPSPAAAVAKPAASPAASPAAAAAAAAAGPAPPGDASHGQVVFNQIGCYACHGTVGQGASTGPKLAPGPLPYTAFAQQVRQPRQDMPRFTPNTLSDQDLADIYAYMQSIQPGPPATAIPLLNH